MIRTLHIDLRSWRAALRTPTLRLATLATLVTLATLATLASCTRENAAFCCTSPDDCAAAGVDEQRRDCADGLACRDNACVAATCATAGCEAAAPVCELATDTCTGCTDASACTRFPATAVCDTASGACVECVAASDCAAAAPICDNLTCRGCTLDTECASGACADDGSCVPEPDAVYLATDGTDALPCSQAAPCATVLFALQQTNNARNHIVFAPGAYTTGEFGLTVGSRNTSALELFVHGGGASLTGGSSDGFVQISLPILIRDLEIVNQDLSDGFAVATYAATRLERVQLGGANGLRAQSQVTATDLTIRTSLVGIQNYAALTIDRARIEGGATGIVSSSGSVDLTNVLVFGTTGVALDLYQTTGSMAFSTVVATVPAATMAPGVRCTTGGIEIRSSIIWTTTAPTNRVGIDGQCSVVTSIVGPVGVVGASNANPLFVTPSANDYHLSGGSPARDMVDTGPATDFEGDPRPRGLRFDIGADEAP